MAAEVAVALLGEPSSRTSRELRFGRHGSLAVDTEHGRWFDHEAKEGGGVLDLVDRERGGRSAALAWLREEGFLPSESPGREFPARGGFRSRRSDSPPPPKAATGDSAARTRLVAALWAAAGPADSSPGHVYLLRRWAWPPADTGPTLPDSVRWLPASRVPNQNPTAKWFGLPSGAKGALVFAWRRPGEAAPCAVSMLAVSSGCDRVLWFSGRAKVCAIGIRTGALFETRAVCENAPPEAAPRPVHVVEGEVDALALTLAPWCAPGTAVYAMGGTSGVRRAGELVPGRGPVEIHCDGDRGGRTAALEAAKGVRQCGREVQIVWYAGDPAETLAEWVGERAAIRETEGGQSRVDARRNAWQDVLRDYRQLDRRSDGRDPD